MSNFTEKAPKDLHNEIPWIDRHLPSPSPAMWRGSATRSISAKLLPSRGSNPNPNPNSPSPLRSLDDILIGRSLSLLLSSQIHSSSRRWKPARSEAVEFSAASPAEASPAVTGSLGSAMKKARDLPVGIRHYGRCYWELSKAKLRSDLIIFIGSFSWMWLNWRVN